jgi:hypothetical protein
MIAGFGLRIKKWIVFYSAIRNLQSAILFTGCYGFET